MKSSYKMLGQYIRPIDVRNTDGQETNLLGVSVQKKFIPSIANTVGTDFTKYKVVKKRQFTYIPDTSRRGDKIGIALLEDYDSGIVSNIYTVFEVIDTEQLLPEYLMLWFMRPEFDRLARFKSHGSVREVFDWEQMCSVELPVPDIEKQRIIVNAYKTINDRIIMKQQINDNLETILATRFSQMRNNAGSRDTICLEKLINFGNGKARPSSVGNIPVYGGNGVLSYTDCYNAENVVLIGRVGAYCGSVYIEEQQCWVSDNAIVAKSKITNDEFFDYFLLKGFNLYDHHVGTGQQLLTQGILNSLECPSYNKEEMESFNKEAKPLFSIMNINNREIRMLNKTASMLLSRLSY